MTELQNELLIIFIIIINSKHFRCRLGPCSETPWEEAEGLLYYNGRVYIPEILRLEIKRRHHDVPLAGHIRANDAHGS